MLRIWLASGLGVMVAAMTVAGGYWWVTIPTTYSEAVIEVLASRQVAFTDLEIRDICLPDPGCIVLDSTRTYHAVIVYHDTVSYGRVTCDNHGGDCYLDLATLGIVHAPLRDLRRVRLLPKPLMEIGELILAHIRVLVRR